MAGKIYEKKKDESKKKMEAKQKKLRIKKQ